MTTPARKLSIFKIIINTGALIAATTSISIFMGSLWVQVWGGGILPYLQRSMGVTEIIKRLEFIELYMPSIDVVSWNMSESRQEGRCTEDACFFVLTGSRTKYGEQCGSVVSYTVEVINPEGRRQQLIDNFEIISTSEHIIEKGYKQ